jgi:hypothetical protein
MVTLCAPCGAGGMMRLVVMLCSVAFSLKISFSSKSMRYKPKLLTLAANVTFAPTFPEMGFMDIIFVSAFTKGKNEMVNVVDNNNNDKSVNVLILVNVFTFKYVPS